MDLCPPCSRWHVAQLRIRLLYNLLNAIITKGASMVLSRTEAQTFYRICWALLDYVNDRLGVAQTMFDANGLYDSAVGCDIAERMWEQRSLIDDFVRENPAGLTPADLEIARKWKHALRDDFAAVEDDARDTILLGRGYAIKACGPTEEISSMFPAVPSYFKTTLVPFGEHVVSFVWGFTYNVSLGPGIRDSLDRELKDALAAGRLITTGDELLAAIPDIEAAREQSRANQETSDARIAQQQKKRQPGTHRGMLAGLAKDVRDEIVARELTRRLRERDGSTPTSILASQCTAPEVANSLTKHLEKMRKDDLQRIARDLDLKRTSSLNKAQLSRRIAEAMASPAILQMQLCAFSPKLLEGVRSVCESGGRISMDEASVIDLRETPTPLPPFLNVTHKDGVFTFVIPEELVEPMALVDWDEVMRDSRAFDLAEQYVSAYVELRGAVQVDELYPSYARVVAEDLRLPVNDFSLVLYGGLLSPYDAVCDFVRLDGSLYAIDFDITEWYPQDYDPLGSLEEMPLPVATKDLAAYMRTLLQARAGKPARDVPADVLDGSDLTEWLVKQPPSIALRDFFDDNVPDGQDDYLYADDLVFEIANMVLRDYQIGEILKYLNEMGYEPDEARLNQMLPLLMEVCNSLPHWFNNGWAPFELSGLGSAERGLLDADTLARSAFGIHADSIPVSVAPSPKIGRNDPCPCGSGKKYKKCCGKTTDA